MLREAKPTFFPPPDQNTTSHPCFPSCHRCQESQGSVVFCFACPKTGCWLTVLDGTEMTPRTTCGSDWFGTATGLLCLAYDEESFRSYHCNVFHVWPNLRRLATWIGVAKDMLLDIKNSNIQHHVTTCVNCCGANCSCARSSRRCMR